MTIPDFQQLKDIVLRKLELELPVELIYHSVVHTRDEVLPAAERLAKLEGVADDEELLLLQTAALFHDVGYIKDGANHEANSALMAVETLPKFGYSQGQIERICQLILATTMPQNPHSDLEKILADADLDVLGREDFFRRSLDLRDELIAKGKEIPLERWYRSQLDLLQKHKYFTESATRLRQPGKQSNIEKLQEMLSDSGPWSNSSGKPIDSREQFELLLARVPIFHSLPSDELRILASTLKPLDFSINTLLFQEGDHGDHFYVVLEGSVEIIKAAGTPEERLLGTRGPGEFIGEMSLLSRDGLRTASARALGMTRLLEMTRTDFNGLLSRQPQIAYEFMRVLSDRLNHSHVSAIQDLQEKNRQLSEAYDELKAAQEQLIEKEKMKRELEVAYKIQMSILPATLPEVEGYDFGSLMVPARSVGGDFYDLVLFSNDKVGIVVGDVTDKGVPAAIFMAQTHALFRAAVDQAKSPGKTLLEVNRHLLEMNRQNLFATVLYGILDCRTGEFSYARAGHELPVVCMPDGKIVIPDVEPGFPLGLFENPDLDQQSLVIPPGSLMLLYTDGVTDAFVRPTSQFGLDGLLEILRRSASLSAQDVCNSIFESLKSPDQPDLLYDDVTLVAISSLG